MECDKVYCVHVISFSFSILCVSDVGKEGGECFCDVGFWELFEVRVVWYSFLD